MITHWHVYWIIIFFLSLSLFPSLSVFFSSLSYFLSLPLSVFLSLTSSLCLYYSQSMLFLLLIKTINIAPNPFWSIKTADELVHDENHSLGVFVQLAYLAILSPTDFFAQCHFSIKIWQPLVDWRCCKKCGKLLSFVTFQMEKSRFL